MTAISGVEPLRLIEGGRLWVHGEGFPLPHNSACGITLGGVPARIAFASPDRLAVEVPAGVPAGDAELVLPWVTGRPIVRIGEKLATGLHQVDSPVFDADGNVYVTYSGSRGQEAPVSVFRVTPAGVREAFVSGIVNATSLAVGPDGLLYVSSRYDGHVYRVQRDGRYDVMASDLGQASGLAFRRDGTLLVGDRSGSVFRIMPGGETSVFVTLPPSVAAYHLAVGHDDTLYVTAPTLGTRDGVYRITPEGAIDRFDTPFGRPQGVAIDPGGALHVVEALAGDSALYRMAADGTTTMWVSGPRLIGAAFSAGGTLAVATGDSVYRF